MKNLFKNLMLVAVAAMAFTACTEENNEVNAVAKKTVLTFTASIDNDGDETRSGFVGSTTEDGVTKYQSAWDGGEKLAIFDMSTYGFITETTINAEGKFDVEFEGDNIPAFIEVRSPASAWSDPNTYTIPAVQTPLANSVDPAAHILYGYVATTGSTISMQHKTSYGKMTLKGVDFDIDHVVIDLNGSWYGYDKSLSYTINADNVEENVFWFSTDVIDVAEFTVTAYDAEGHAYTKTVDVAEAGKTLSFNFYKVSSFSVSGLEEAAEPEGLVFTSAKWVNYSYSDKLVQFYTESGATLQLNWYNCGSDAWIVPNTYGFASSGAIYPGGEYSWYENTAAGIDTEIVGGTVIVSVVDGQYYIEFKNLADYSAVQIESATFTGEITGLQVPDGRTPLAAPSVTATAEGNIITLSWEAVTGADEYYVFCYAGGLDAITTTETTVTIEAAYSTKYDFLIRAVANETNPDYKTSEDYYFSVTTEKDPNGPFAEYLATDLYWDNGGYFVFVVDRYEIFRVKMNDADCPNHTTIKEGTYTAVASSTVPAGSFSVYQKVVGGYSEGWSSTKNTSTMSVEYVDGEYVIIVNYIGAWGGSGEVGYKGVPSGWDVPTGGESGGDEPVDPDPDQPGSGEEPEPTPDPETPIAVSWSYVVDTSNSGTYGHMWSVSSGDDAFFANVTMDSRSGYSTSTSFTPGVFNYHAQYADGNYGSGMWFTMRSIKINGTEYSNYDVDGTITVTDDGGVYTLKMEIYKLINGYRTDKLATMVGTI